LLAQVRIPAHRREEMQRSLIRSHAAGVGTQIEREVVRGMMLLRVRSLSMGRSGARPVVAATMLEMLNAGLTPVVPEYGSVGASGDLAPLAHCALALIGEGEVTADDGHGARPSAEALAQAGMRAGDADRERGARPDQRHRRDARNARSGHERSPALAEDCRHRRGDVG